MILNKVAKKERQRLKDKKIKSFYLENQNLVLGKFLLLAIILFCGIIFIFSLCKGLYVDTTTKILTLSIFSSVTVFTFCLENPLTVILTRAAVDQNKIIVRRFYKRFEFYFNDINSVAIMAKYDRRGRTPYTYFFISKSPDPPLKDKIKRSYFVKNESFLVSCDKLQNLKAFFDNYNKQIINLEKFREELPEQEFLYLQSRCSNLEL